MISLDVNFCKDHSDETEVPDPLAVEDLISCKLNNQNENRQGWIQDFFSGGGAPLLQHQ